MISIQYSIDIKVSHCTTVVPLTHDIRTRMKYQKIRNCQQTHHCVIIPVTCRTLLIITLISSDRFDYFHFSLRIITSHMEKRRSRMTTFIVAQAKWWSLDIRYWCTSCHKCWMWMSQLSDIILIKPPWLNGATMFISSLEIFSHNLF